MSSGIREAERLLSCNDFAAAREQLERLASAGDAQAQFMLAELLADGKGGPEDVERACQLLESACAQDYAPALSALGVRHYRGNAVQKDCQRAVELFLKAAMRGFCRGQMNLALMYFNGDGVAQDYEQAARWFEQAAKQGVCFAHYNLGVMYEEGLGVEVSIVRAAEHFREAAEQGDADAQYRLARLYDHGRGLGQDFKEAARWYEKAAENGVTEARSALSLLVALRRVTTTITEFESETVIEETTIISTATTKKRAPRDGKGATPSAAAKASGSANDKGVNQKGVNHKGIYRSKRPMDVAWNEMVGCLQALYGENEFCYQVGSPRYDHFGQVLVGLEPDLAELSHMIDEDDDNSSIEPFEVARVFRNTTHPDHWHYVTFGLSDLYGRNKEVDTEFSGLGFELTIRVAAEDETPPYGPLNALREMARYVYSSKRIFERGQYIDAGGPVAPGSNLEGFAVTLDTQLGVVQSLSGRVELLQVFGLTRDELEWVKDNDPETLLQVMARTNPLLVTFINRDSIFLDPASAKLLKSISRSKKK